MVLTQGVEGGGGVFQKPQLAKVQSVPNLSLVQMQQKSHHSQPQRQLQEGEKEVFFELHNLSFSEFSSPVQSLPIAPHMIRKGQGNLPLLDHFSLSTKHSQVPSIKCTRPRKGSSLQPHNALLTAVCLNERCLDEKKFMTCSVCREEDHQFHEQVLLSTLVADVNALAAVKTKKRQVVQKTETVKIIQQIQASIFKDISLLQKQVGELYERLEERKNRSLLERLDGLANCRSENMLQSIFLELMKTSHEMCSELSNVDVASDAAHEVVKSILSNLHESVQEVFSKQSELITHVQSSSNSRKEERGDGGEGVGRLGVSGGGGYLLSRVSSHTSFGSARTFETNQSAESLKGRRKVEASICLEGQQVDSDKSLNGSVRWVTSYRGTNSCFSIHSEGDSDVTCVSATTMPQPSKANGSQERVEFSKTMRDPNIILSFRKIVNGSYQRLSNGEEQRHYRVQLAQPDLGNVEKKWSFRITQQQQQASPWLAFGMCHVNGMRSRQYKFVNNEFSLSREEEGAATRVGSNNHGCYLLTTQGCVLANGKQARRTTMRFAKDDIINCRFDPFKKILIFGKNNINQKESEKEEEEISVEFEPIFLNKLYPCFIMSNPQDSLQLL